jgi:hypothetical protein
MKLIDIVESSRELPWAHIDCGLRQGQTAILRHLQNQLSDYKEDEYSSANLWVLWMQDALVELSEHVKPNHIPEEYNNFLEHYGGLSIDGVDSYFSALGIGPMTETWYGNLIAENRSIWEANITDWLNIGELVFHRNHKYYGQRVLFYLDLVGIVQKDSVIGIGPWNGVDPKELEILKNIHTYSSLWKKSANSFSEWLMNAVETRGMFSYT